jgi:hypothetical protein
VPCSCRVQYYIRTWYNGYLRCQDAKSAHALFVGDVKDEKQATPFQLLPLGVPAEELKQRSQNLTSSIKYLASSFALHCASDPL